MYNTHKGETGVVVCNGPSLNKVPLDFLSAYPTFGTNRIFLHEQFKPTYYVSVNPLVLEQSAEGIASLECMKFVRQGFEDKFGAVPLRSASTPLFMYNPLQWIYEGYTVTFVCLQLAFYMGFTTVLLVGLDHRFEYDGDPNEQQTFKGKDVNHFHPDYFTGLQWNLPDLEASEHAYGLAEEAYSAVNRQVINLTPGTALEVFEKGMLSKWM